MPDDSSSNLFLDQLAAEGTKFVFGSPGPTVRPILESIGRRSDMKYIFGLHESTAIGMATGYAQYTGKPGVANVSATSGLTNGLSAILNAWTARTPLVVTVGQQDNRIINEFHPADDLKSIARSCCKWTCELRTAEELPKMLRRAFHEAMSAPMGPVVVSLPVNLLRQSSSVRVMLPPRSSPLGAADAGFIKRATQILSSATKPVIIVGNEVSQYAARKEVVALAELMGCPTFCEPIATGLNFPNRHPLFAGVLPFNQAEAHELLRSHDVVLVLGMQTRRPPSFDDTSLIPSAAVVIQISMDPALSGQSLPCHFSAHANLSETLTRLKAEMMTLIDTQWVNSSKARTKLTASWVSSLKNTTTQEPVAPGATKKISLKWFLSLLDSARPQKSIIINDCGSQQATPIQIMDLEHCTSYLATNGKAPGYGAPAAMGAQLAGAEQTVICLSSDSSFLYQPQSLWTAAHYNLPTKIIILNSQGVTLLNDDESGKGEESSASVQILNPPVSFLELAGSMGVPANSISQTAEIEQALKEMFETEGPYLLDVRLSG